MPFAALSSICATAPAVEISEAFSRNALTSQISAKCFWVVHLLNQMQITQWFRSCAVHFQWLTSCAVHFQHIALQMAPSAIVLLGLFFLGKTLQEPCCHMMSYIPFLVILFFLGFCFMSPWHVCVCVCVCVGCVCVCVCVFVRVCECKLPTIPLYQPVIRTCVLRNTHWWSEGTGGKRKRGQNIAMTPSVLWPCGGNNRVIRCVHTQNNTNHKQCRELCKSGRISSFLGALFCSQEARIPVCSGKVWEWATCRWARRSLTFSQNLVILVAPFLLTADKPCTPGLTSNLTSVYKTQRDKCANNQNKKSPKLFRCVEWNLTVFTQSLSHFWGKWKAYSMKPFFLISTALANGTCAVKIDVFIFSCGSNGRLENSVTAVMQNNDAVVSQSGQAGHSWIWPWFRSAYVNPSSASHGVSRDTKLPLSCALGCSVWVTLRQASAAGAILQADWMHVITDTV